MHATRFDWNPLGQMCTKFGAPHKGLATCYPCNSQLHAKRKEFMQLTLVVEVGAVVLLQRRPQLQAQGQVRVADEPSGVREGEEKCS